jgi:adenosylhomocysteine nucleosidase
MTTTRVALLFAMNSEFLPFSRRVSLHRDRAASEFRRGRLGDVDLVVGLTGVGHRRAHALATKAVSTYTPDLVVMAGVAGGLVDDLGIADVIAADAVVSLAGLERAGLIADLGPGRQRVGTLYSTDVIVSAADKKLAAAADVAAAHGSAAPLGVEMENGPVAAVARAAGVPWAGVRTLSDVAQQDLPLDMERLRDPKDGHLRSSRVLGAALVRPRALAALPKIGAETSKATRHLAAYLEEWLRAGTPGDRPAG